MNPCEWHWARLKKDLLIDDKYLLHFTETDPFTVPKGALMWVYYYTTTYGNGIRIAISDAHIEKKHGSLSAFAQY